MKTTHTYIIIAVLLLMSMTACNTTDTSEQKQATPAHNVAKAPKDAMLTPQQYKALQMHIDTLQTRNMNGYVEANGQLEVPPQSEAIITSVVGANVVAIEVIEGDKVNKGQTMLYISHPSIIEKQTMYLNSYSESQYLKKEFDRQKTLYDAGVGSGANFQKAEATYLASQNKVRGLEAQLKQLNINTSGVRNGTIYQRVALRSPIEGFVQKVEVRTGQYVEPQTDLIEVVNTHHVHADLMVFEKDVYKVTKGQKVRFNVQSIPGKELTAEIYSVGKTFEQTPKALHVHAEIENKEGHLIPGMYIQGRIQTENIKTTAFPEEAIAIDGETSYVFTAEEAIAIDGETSYVFTAQEEGNDWSFVPVKVITGEKDGNWVAVRFLESPAPNTRYAMNNAYYLIAELKKGDAGHSH